MAGDGRTRRFTAIAAASILAVLGLVLLGAYLWDRQTQHAELLASPVSQLEIDGATRVATVKHFVPWPNLQAGFVYPTLEVTFDVHDPELAAQDLATQLRAAGYDVPPGLTRVDGLRLSPEGPMLIVDDRGDQIVLTIGTIEG